jgi:type V secretory pathway adhesin AidA
MSIEAMKQALEALERAVSTCFDRRAHEDVMSRPEHFINQTIIALRLAIEQAEKQEPVAWANINKHGDITHTNNKRMPWSKTPLYTTPPAAQRQWVGLTEKDFSAINQSCLTKLQAATSAESILREKNT